MPEDLSLVAFDDFASEFVVEPFLTVVDQPAAEMGKRAAELLLARMAEDDDDRAYESDHGYEEIVLPTRVIVRKSSAAPSQLSECEKG